MKQKNLKGTMPNLNKRGISSSKRITGLRSMSDFNPPENFDPDELSWVTPRLAVSDWEGGVQAYRDGEFVICVAEELRDLGHVYIPVDPTRSPVYVTESLDRISALIKWVLSNSNKRVVIHCAMGMERSVLAAVWYLKRYQNMTLDEAYSAVGEVRPIAVDRRDWIQ